MRVRFIDASFALFYVIFLRRTCNQYIWRISSFRLPVWSCFSCGNSRTHSVYYSDASYVFANCADYTNVSGTCRWSDPDLCGAFRKKQGECKAAAGEINSWIRRRKYNYNISIWFRWRKCCNISSRYRNIFKW